MAEQNCSSCRYFHVGFGDRIGVCRRYPSFQNRSMNEWCGEYSPPMIALPVIDPPQLDAKIEVDLPTNYVRKVDIDARLDKIDNVLERIFDKLDEKADKQ